MPTDAKLLAEITAHAIKTVAEEPKFSGIYHLAPHGEISWYEYANYVIREAKKLGGTFLVSDILPILSIDYNVPAKRHLIQD